MIETLAFILTGLSIAASITYYAINLQTANKARKGQLLMQAYARLDTPYRITALMNMFKWNFKTWDEFIDTAYEDWASIHVYFEGLAPLVRLGHIDIEYVAALIGGGLIKYWDMIIPIKAEADEFLYPRWCAETEYLYNEVKKFMDEHPEYEY